MELLASGWRSTRQPRRFLRLCSARGVFPIEPVNGSKPESLLSSFDLVSRFDVKQPSPTASCHDRSMRRPRAGAAPVPAALRLVRGRESLLGCQLTQTAKSISDRAAQAQRRGVSAPGDIVAKGFPAVPLPQSNLCHSTRTKLRSRNRCMRNTLRLSRTLLRRIHRPHCSAHPYPRSGEKRREFG